MSESTGQVGKAPPAGRLRWSARRGSIRARLVASLLRVGVLASALVLLLLAGQIFLQELQSAQARLDDIEGSTAPAIARALWSVDHERVDALVGEISRRTGVVRVTLVSSEGERWQRGAPWAEAWLVRDISLSQDTGAPFELGELQVVVGRAYLLSRMGEQIMLLGPAMLLVILGMSVLIFRQFRDWVTRPLEQISEYARKADEASIADELVQGPRASIDSDDEIDQLVVALNSLRRRLHGELQHRAEHEEELTRQQAQLERIVEERTQELASRYMELVEAKSKIESARQRAEESTARFSDFTDISADGFWESDANLKLTLISDNFARLMGVGADQMVGLTPAEAYRKRFPEAPDLDSYMAPLLARERLNDQLLQMRTAEGEQRWVLNNALPVHDDDGNFAGYRGTVTDITERVEIERALKASERRLRTITDSVPALISYIDQDRVFRFNNKMYAEWLRRPMDEITGRRLDEVYDEVSYTSIAPHLDTAFGGERVSFEVEIQQRVYRATYVPDVGTDGKTRGVYGLIHDITRLKRVEQELRDAAMVDALTGLPNRRRFEEMLRIAIERSERTGKAMALMFLDLDRFKQVNDTLGHEAGDSLLKELGRRLRESIRATDTAARLAGDEFVVILEGLSRDTEAARVGDKLLEAAAVPMPLADQSYRMSISIGIAMRQPGERDGEALLRRADAGLYAAKAAGRGCYRFAETASKETVSPR